MSQVHVSCNMTKPTKWVCSQRRLRSAWASTHLIRVFVVLINKAGSLATQWVHSENSDQTGRMPRLIWVFTGCIVTLLVLSWGGSCSLKHFWQSSLQNASNRWKVFIDETLDTLHNFARPKFYLIEVTDKSGTVRVIELFIDTNPRVPAVIQAMSST